MRIAYSNPWFRVAEENGYHWVEEPAAENGAAVLVVADDAHVVMLEVHRPAVGATLLEIPRGYGAPGETAEQCARREVREETGYELSALTHLGWLYPNSGILRSRVRLFLGQTRRDLRRHARDTEAERVLLVPLDQLPRWMAEGRITDGFTLAAYGLFLGQRLT